MRKHSQRGATMPEMAVAAACFFALLFGIIDFSRALYTYNFVGQLAREGARYWIVRGSTSCTNSNSQLANCNATTAEITAYVKSLNEGATSTPLISVSPAPVSCPNGGVASTAPGCTVSVTVTYPFKFMMGFVPKATLNMSSTSEMVVSQ
jgi:Flp pilus assembly protein TadG